jgi:2-polyprenyl-3-methyl-5-hydroxy-6-metoxy-1,4-benzoquinol methylase
MTTQTMTTTTQKPWQLLMFQKGLKKQLRLNEFKQLLGKISPDEECLLVTCGDNNGAMNYCLRELGGKWSWADLEDKSIPEMSELLGEDVLHVQYDHLPFPDGNFERVISIDVHEHLKDPHTFTKELSRVAKDNSSVVITVPGGDPKKLANIIKEAVGMSVQKYGHQRLGYSAAELKEIMQSSSINPCRERTFSRFFTEMLELGINYLYVNILTKKSNVEVEEGTIAPATEAQLKSVKKSYLIYSLVYPFFWLISKLDLFLMFSEGYVVIVEGKKQKLA